MAQLHFSVKNQWISRTDNFRPVGRSKNYLYAKFSFLTDEWVGVATALFRKGNILKDQLIGSDGVCQVPPEVLDFDGEFTVTVSVFCGSLVTANKANIRVYETGYEDDGEHSHPPTPSVYEQILERLSKVEYLEVDAETLVEGSQATIQKFVDPETGGYIFDFGIPKGDTGNGIENVEKTGTAGLVDTYTITFTDGATYSFNVVNGEDGTSPEVTVTQIENGHRLEITDAVGTHTFDILDGADGFSPSVSISNIPNGHRITVTDAERSQSFDVLDGRNGDDGISPVVTIQSISGGHTVTITDRDGSHSFDVMDGQDGISPLLSVTDITDGHRVSITDAGGTKSFDVMNGAPGQKGDEGVSPVITVTDVNGGHDVSITDKTGTHTFRVMDGANGDDGYSPSVNIVPITDGNRITITDKTGAHTFDIIDGETGVGISDISKTSTHDAEDTYTITYTDGSTTTFVVTNGEVTWNDVGNIAVVSHTQPSSSHNVIWIEDEGTTIELPTMEDLEEVTDDVNDLKADINQLEDALNVKEGARYGVIGIGQKSANLSRLWDAAGMRAQVGTDGDNSSVVNDFDHALPFMRRKCVGYWSAENGEAVFHVTAYEVK